MILIELVESVDDLPEGVDPELHVSNILDSHDGCIGGRVACGAAVTYWSLGDMLPESNVSTPAGSQLVQVPESLLDFIITIKRSYTDGKTA